jgi:hypothetical protein
MSSSGERATNEPADQLAQENINDLGRIITSEADGLDETAQAMVGWTVVNHMKQHHYARVSLVWTHGNHVHNHMPTSTRLRLAESILNGTARDISQGVTHFYSPVSMPKEGEPSSRTDVHGGVESVSGVMKNNRPVRNYRPGWAKRTSAVRVPDIQDKDFKFYRSP